VSRIFQAGLDVLGPQLRVSSEDVIARLAIGKLFASSLIDCFFSQSSGVVFNIAGLWKFLHAACPASVTFPLRMLFLFAFQRFSLRRIQVF
jgi:hypothetical protein